tara:strand:- start:187 stop:504 length:318 start_codon:yes stop_codon:yes gene_type:complete
MGNFYSFNRKIIPTSYSDELSLENNLKYIEDEKYVKIDVLLRLINLNQILEKELANIQKNNFECVVCYEKNSDCKKKINCHHDLCMSCHSLMYDKRCPICRKNFT